MRPTKSDTLVYAAAALSLVTAVAAARADIILSGDASATDPISAGTGGTDGAITVNNGSSISSPTGGSIGNAPGSTGQLMITGAGSSVATGGGPGNSLDIGFSQGVGNLTVELNGLLTVDAFIDPDFSDARLNIGRGGNANVVLQSGAQVFVRDQNLSGSDDGVMVGASTNFPSDLAGTATLTVQDEGTYLEVIGNLAFLNTGASNTPFTGTAAANGTINVISGADVLVDGQTSVGIISAGRGGNASGTVNVCGAGSTVTITGTVGILSIGDNFTSATGSGTGGLNICDNAVVNLNGQFGGSFTVGIHQASGLTIIDSGGRLNVNAASPGSSSGGTVAIGGNFSAGGTLLVNDSGVLSANLIRVLPNGTVGGTGTIIGFLQNLGGTILPGASPGTLTVDGPLTFNSGLLEIEITPGGSDIINATGDVVFNGGTVRFVFSEGSAPSAGDTIAFIDANSVSGLDGQANVNYEVAGLLDGFEFSVDASSGIAEVTAQNEGIPDFVAPIVALRPHKSGRINPNSNAVFPLVMFTTQISPMFDATDIDPSTVRFGPGAARPILRKTAYKDVDKDGYTDVRLWFRVKNTGIACGDMNAELTGQTHAGTSFAANVDFQTKGCKGTHKESHSVP